MKVTLTADDGREYDVTEHFQVMYDNLVNGMDWGSGFLDGNDALIIMQAGAAAGFEVVLDYTGSAMVGETSPALKAFPYPQPTSSNLLAYGSYHALKDRRAKWVTEQLGDPPTWDSIATYREKLREMEDATD